MTEAGGRRIKLADYDPEQRAPGTVFQPGKDERHRFGQHDTGEKLDARR